MEETLDKLLAKMVEGTLSEEEALLIESKASKFSNLHQLADARNEWREALRKLHDARARQKDQAEGNS